MSEAQEYLQHIQDATNQAQWNIYITDKKRRENEKRLSSITKWLTISGSVALFFLFLKATQK